MAKVFISYAHKDEAFAEALAQAVESKIGPETIWRDKNQLLPSEKFEQSILEALRGASVVIVIWSENSRESDWVKREASIADFEGKLIQVVIDGQGAHDLFAAQQYAEIDPSYRPVDRDHVQFRNLVSAIEARIELWKEKQLAISEVANRPTKMTGYIPYILVGGLSAIIGSVLVNYTGTSTASMIGEYTIAVDVDGWRRPNELSKDFYYPKNNIPDNCTVGRALSRVSGGSGYLNLDTHAILRDYSEELWRVDVTTSIASEQDASGSGAFDIDIFLLLNCRSK
ncbi:MAG: toll/interleukin-1 receptor domain-containing protein [Pseudomonadota bacterium]